jgi:hypothetical protein
MRHYFEIIQYREVVCVMLTDKPGGFCSLLLSAARCSFCYILYYLNTIVNGDVETNRNGLLKDINKK